MTPERKRQAEEAARKYADDNFATQYDDEYWIGKSSYLQGWMDADSTPAPSEVGDEEFIKAECSKFNENGWGADITEKGIRLGLAYARRTQNAEVEKLKKEVEELKDIRDADTIRIDELRSLLERANRLQLLSPQWQESLNGFDTWGNWRIDYEKLIGKKG